MDSEVIGQADPDPDILAFDVPDYALERAASAAQNAMTWIYCTNVWHACEWPQ